MKMVLIYLRVMHKIPNVIMGQTGCGKTALLRYLALNVLKIHPKNFRIFNIHAGITKANIINELEKSNNEASKLSEN